MLPDAEISKRKEKLTQLLKESGEIKRRLASLNTEKESWFTKKTDIGKKIQELIEQVKGSKEKRNKLTQQVKTKKEERQKFNTAVKEQVEKLKSAKEIKDKAMKSAGPKGNPYKLEQAIEKLEYKLITEPMGFSQEQKIMKEIKAKKKELGSVQSVKDVVTDFKKITKAVNKTRKTADKIHKELKEDARKSQEYHEEILKISEEIDKLKVDEDDAHKKFVESKEHYLEVQKELKEKQSEISAIKEELIQNNVVIKEESKKKDIAKVKAKQKQVEERVKKGGAKLTTEDLLAFQAGMGKIGDKRRKKKPAKKEKTKSEEKSLPKAK